ncbi:MAG: aminopeptidase N [Bdellovibrionota bacterium]
MTEANNSYNKRYRLNYQSPAYAIEKIELFFELDSEKTKVRSRWNYKQLKTDDLVLHGKDLNLISVHLNEKEIPKNQLVLTDQTLTLKNLPQQGQIEIKVEINPSKNESLEGLYLSKGSLCTQCEPEGFRKITYFMDRPDVMSDFTVTIEADKKTYPILLSNGDRLSYTDLENGRHRAIYRDPHKKPCYLFALFAGDLGLLSDEFTTRSGKNIKLEIYSPHGTQERCKHAMSSLKKAMKWDEDRFGLEYDLDQYMIVAIDDFNAGAMENKGLNIFNSRLILADSDTATDDDYFNIESVVGHEYFHNWTGNRVTLRDWFELSLKEGLTVFRDQEFSGDMTNRQLQRIRDVDSLRERQFAEDVGPKAHPVRPDSCLSVDNFFTATIYEKGAEVIRMMQTLVGRPGFRKGMDEYFRRYDGHAVTIENFAQAIAEPNNIDFTQFRLWYSQYGTPQVDVNESYDSSTKTYALELKQSLPTLIPQQNLKAMLIPLRVGLLNSHGKEIEIQHPRIKRNSENQSYIELKDWSESIQFAGMTERPRLSILRDFSAPINLNWHPPIEDLYFLIEHDSDGFNRRELLQRIELNLLTDWIQKLSQSHELKKEDLPAAFLACFKKILNDPEMNSELKALMLTLPSENRLLQSIQQFEPRYVEKSLNFLAQSLAKELEADFMEIFKSAAKTSDKPESRALKNRILSYLAEIKDPKYDKLIAEQYRKAQVMTERFHALRLLCEQNSTETKMAIEDFHSKYQSNSLVLNKWFMAQALSRHADAFEQVKSLCKHPDFNIKNPNNVYSLLRAFGQNLTRFHDWEKSTYEFMLDKIFEIDGFNPQVAARLFEAFQTVGKWPQEQQDRLISYLRKKIKDATVSSNTQEWVDSILQPAKV